MGKPSKAALERDNDSLRSQIADLKLDHDKAIKAKNQALEQAHLGDILYQLGDTFPHLRSLITQLRQAHLESSPLRSPGGDGRSEDNPTPLQSAASTETQRNRTSSIDAELEALTNRIKLTLTPRDRGPIEDLYRPQCWNPGCPTRASFQAFDRTECVTCGEPFGRYRPLNDLTRPVELRCFVRGCPGRNKVNQCIHSWLKMDAPGSEHVKAQGS